MSNTIPDRTQKTKPELTAERVRELFDYDPETGELRWKVARRDSWQGRAAGTLKNNGYRYVKIDRRAYRAHRLVWLHWYGVWPEDQIDHTNGNRQDNRLSNLRSAAQSENQQNQRRASSNNRSTGLLGVSRPSGRSKYQAWIMAQGRNRYLGTFGTPEEAHAAYLAAKRQLHPGCTI